MRFLFNMKNVYIAKRRLFATPDTPCIYIALIEHSRLRELKHMLLIFSIFFVVVIQKEVFSVCLHISPKQVR